MKIFTILYGLFAITATAAAIPIPQTHTDTSQDLHPIEARGKINEKYLNNVFAFINAKKKVNDALKGRLSSMIANALLRKKLQAKKPAPKKNLRPNNKSWDTTCGADGLIQIGRKVWDGKDDKCWSKQL